MTGSYGETWPPAALREIAPPRHVVRTRRKRR